ncbi:DUF6497 family protein [Roseicyclus sp. F158]|uniref:DUF6497 family protein n=1 Tax=Tropicimonas omnivorans TaxID=3075590 RepID=A0ABU3DEI8_9RHOB|nr:DUF6497 family protein [Roseicyclus sp. F158]MDT0682129.1 DUF6497 family protein [Roseicyclus sp. F158]
MRHHPAMIRDRIGSGPRNTTGQGGADQFVGERQLPGIRARSIRAGVGRRRRGLRSISLSLSLLLASAAVAGPLPSGQEVIPLDRFVERQASGETWLILRYLAPRIAAKGGDLDYMAVEADLDALCAEEVSGVDAQKAQDITVILLDRPVERGASDTDATMFIGAYRVEQGACVWQ